MSNLKVAVLGAGGILGQSMMISVPPDVDATFVRKTPSPLADSLDLTDWAATEAWLNARRPDVIVNLAGESRVDVVERDPGTQFVNVILPQLLASWCDQGEAHLVHVSSQAALDPVNLYGRQKKEADWDLERCRSNWTIIRPTFVLGIRPFPAIGRENPAEAMLRGEQTAQVNNRWFSVSFAWDVADMLWSAARKRSTGVIQCGNPERLTRYALARMLNPTGDFEAVDHETLAELWPLAPRPIDTTFSDAHFETSLAIGLQRLRREYEERAMDKPESRARELGAFLRIPWERCSERLAQGFGPLHNAVTADFNRAAPKTDDELLNWYRTTLAYLYELTAYHCDAGFNYSGMCEGIITRLKSHQMPSRFHQFIGGAEVTDHSSERNVKRVLCLGDGVGTLTIKMREAGLEPVYHDLAASRTSDFARFRLAARFPDIDNMFAWLTRGNEPKYMDDRGLFDAVCSLDYLEHVPNVEDWVRAIYGALKPGGLFCAQNGFAMGSGPDGAMPMHLACNDRFERDWDPLLAQIGFVQLASNWYQKPEGK